MPKFWGPQIPYLDSVAEYCKGMRLVVDVGANKNYKFPASTVTVGFGCDYDIDLCSEDLPFEDGSVDFLFCRHTIEDLADPTHLLREIKRVAKQGYIETPSPVVETSRHVDFIGGHMGYMHHRWICYVEDDVFTCLAKYPIIERLPVQDYWEELEYEPDLWNTKHHFAGEFQYAVIQNEQGLDMREFSGRELPSQYMEAVNDAQAAYMEQYLERKVKNGSI